MKQTLKEAGYILVHALPNKQYILLGTEYELFFANKNHASWGIKYRNTHLEFCASLTSDQVARLIHPNDFK